MGAPPLPPAAAHAFVDDLLAPRLGADDARHLGRVLRLRPGQAVTVSDGAGGWRPCTWQEHGGLEPSGPVAVVPAADPAVTVAFALTKGERPEWVVQKLTEVGVDRILPFRAERSVVRWEPAKAAAQVERWRRVARAAAMQSRRVRLPDVIEVDDFAGTIATLGDRAALADAGGAPVSLAHPAVLVGPEGGWSDAERAAGGPLVGLGSTVLRAETAAVVAGALLCALRDGTIPPERGRRGYDHDG